MHVEEDNQFSVPRGGPIYLADMVSSITRVHDFETAAVEELEGLKADLLLWDCSEVSEEDISVNKLKILSEEELVKLAFEEAFQDDEVIGNSSEVIEDQSHTGKNPDGRTPICENASLEGSGVLENAPVSHELPDTSPPGTCNSGEADGNHRMPNGGNAHLEVSGVSESALVSHKPSPGICNSGESGKNNDGGTHICENSCLEGSGASENLPESHEPLDNFPRDGRAPICENPCLEGSEALENAPVLDEPLDTSPPGTCENGAADRKTMKKRKRGHASKEKEPTPPPETCSNGDSDRKITKKRKTRHTGKKKKYTSPSETSIIGASDRQIMKTRKGRNASQKKPTKEKYIAKVERIVEIKKKQDEERKTAKLHALKTNKSANSHSDTTERLKVLKSMSSKMKVKPSDFCEHVPVEHPEVVLSIEVYHNKRTWAKNQEFLVLACQRLTELKDRITCLTDELMSKSGVHSTSGYFLIEDVFYNDMRDKFAVDYSQPIMTWLRDSKEEALEKWEFLKGSGMPKKQKEVLGSAPATQLPHFRTANMDKMRFRDLRFRLGAGYLYCHQGDCKHTIIIRDMRLVHPEDVQNRAAYPLITYQAKLRFQKCSICNITRAEKVTVDDKWAPENPCYFCPNCYYMLHYKDRKLLYDTFSVYDYIHD